MALAEDNHQLLAAVATCNVARAAGMRPDTARDSAKAIVTCLVTVGIVELLEAVGIY
jgi:hypothetical protein